AFLNALVSGGEGRAPRAIKRRAPRATRHGTVAWRAGELTGRTRADGVVLSGALHPVMSAPHAEWLLAPAVVEGRREWWLLAADEISVAPLDSLDLTRRVATVTVNDVRLPLERRTDLDDIDVDAT